MLNGFVEHAACLQDPEGAGFFCLPRKVLEVRGVETLVTGCFVTRDQRHVPLWDAVHISKSGYSGLALCGSNEVVDVVLA